MDGMDDVIVEMSEQESWDFLAAQGMGRLAYKLFDDLGIAPINHVVDDQRIVFRTAEGTKLLGIATAGEVCFEVDEVDGNVATSVIARGTGRVLEGQEAEHADTLPLRPWVPTLKYNYVAIEVTDISGRRFQLGEEPERSVGVY